MKKKIVLLSVLVGIGFLLSANGYGRNREATENNDGTRMYQYQNNDTGERLRKNVGANEDCTLEGDEVGTGYLDENNRKHENQSNSKGMGRNRA